MMIYTNYRRAYKKDDVPCKDCKWAYSFPHVSGRPGWRCKLQNIHRVGGGMTCDLAGTKAKEVTP